MLVFQYVIGFITGKLIALESVLSCALTVARTTNFSWPITWVRGPVSYYSAYYSAYYSTLTFSCASCASCDACVSSLLLPPPPPPHFCSGASPSCACACACVCACVSSSPTCLCHFCDKRAKSISNNLYLINAPPTSFLPFFSVDSSWHRFIVFVHNLSFFFRRFDRLLASYLLCHTFRNTAQRRCGHVALISMNSRAWERDAPIRACVTGCVSCACDA